MKKLILLIFFGIILLIYPFTIKVMYGSNSVFQTGWPSHLISYYSGLFGAILTAGVSYSILYKSFEENDTVMKRQQKFEKEMFSREKKYQEELQSLNTLPYFELEFFSLNKELAKEIKSSHNLFRQLIFKNSGNDSAYFLIKNIGLNMACNVNLQEIKVKDIKATTFHGDVVCLENDNLKDKNLMNVKVEEVVLGQINSFDKKFEKVEIIISFKDIYQRNYKQSLFYDGRAYILPPEHLKN